MQPADLLVAIDREGQALAAAASDALDRPVPSCEGWTVADVVAHVGRVFISVGNIVRTRSTEIILPDESYTPPGPDELVAWFGRHHDALLRHLADIDPDEPVYTWAGVQGARFYHRRMAHETAVHRWDVERAVVGDAGPVDGRLAVDGISELYDVVLPFALRRWSGTLPDRALRLERTDGPESWTVAPDGDGIVLDGDGAEVGARLGGPASDLFLFAWHRVPLDDLELDGDEAVARAWASLAP